MSNEKEFVTGIDLHGTLLDAGESIPHRFHEPLHRAAKKASGALELYTCTGNDLPFVQAKIPSGVLSFFSGHILETGCVLGEETGEERVLVDIQTEARVLELKEICAGRPDALAPVEYFLRRRLATVSLFCCAEHLCFPPEQFLPLVEDFLRVQGWDRWFWACHSSVAVDIIPKGFNKFRGLKLIAGQKKTIGVADSDNDRDLILKSDMAFAPSNMSGTLRRAIEQSGRAIAPLGDLKSPLPGVVGLASEPEIAGVIQILNFLAEKL